MKKYLLVTFLCVVAFETGNGQAPDWQWAKATIGNWGRAGTNIATDMSGNIYVIGNFSCDSIIFGLFTLHNDTTDSTSDIFLVKYNQEGNVIWARSAQGDSMDYCYGLAVDASGNIYITGTFRSRRITFDTTYIDNNAPSYNNFNLYIAKYDSSGNLVWARGATNYGSAAGYGIVVDANANVYLTGYFAAQNITFDSITLVQTFGFCSIFMAKFDSSGNAMMAKSTMSRKTFLGKDISVDSLYNIYVVGTYYDTVVVFGNDTLRSTGLQGRHEIFTVKYDSSGNIMWARSGGGKLDDVVSSMVSDINGNVYLTGAGANDTINFGSNQIINTDSTYWNTFFVKYDSQGNVSWAKGVNTERLDWGSSVALDSDGNVYLTGYFESDSITFSGIRLLNGYSGTFDLYIYKCDSQGNALWGKSAGGTRADEQGIGTAVDSNNNFFITGTYTHSFPSIFGNTVLPVGSTYYHSFYIAKLGECAANFSLYPDTTQAHHYFAVNNSVGVPPLVYDWSWGDGTHDYTAYPSHVYADSGYYTICVTIADSVGCSSTYCDSSVFLMRGTSSSTMVYVNVVDSVVMEVPKAKEDCGISIYPNPAINMVAISGRQCVVMQVEIYNLFGEIFLSSQKGIGSQQQEVVFDVSQLPSSIYFIKVIEENQITIAKFIKL